MISKQLDWLTLTAKTVDNRYSSDFLHFILKMLCLDCFELKGKYDDDNGHCFKYVGRDKYYECVYRYNDISLLTDWRRGICIRFSGNGFAFYQEHLKDYGLTLQTVCRRFRASSVDGIITNVTRFDYAMDDKVSSDIPYDKAYLTMSRVRDSLRRGEVRSRLTVDRKPHNYSLDVSEDTSSRNCEPTGDTIYLGRRKGGAVVVRFYDKLLERKSGNHEIDDKIISWTRCEFEFHDSRAMAVFNAFCDMSESDFSAYMSEVVNNYVQFIYIDDSNRSRCTVKRWWARFMKTVEKSSLIIPPFKASTFEGTKNWLEKSVFPTLIHFINVIGLRKFLHMVYKYIDKPKTPRIKQMINDFQTVKERGFKLSDTVIQYEDYVRERCIEPWLVTSNHTEDDLKRENKACCESWQIIERQNVKELGLDDPFEFMCLMGEFPYMNF